MDEIYPEKNRTKDILDVLDIKIMCDNAMFEYQPNELLQAFLNEELRLLKPTDEKSILSGKEGFIYRADNLRIVLTYEELKRLILLNLKPDEFYKLRGYYGNAYEWHDDFYHPLTGEAFQPHIKE